MTPWSAFYDLLAPEVPGCPQVAQTLSLRRAAIAFCEQSLVWQESHNPISVETGTAEYDYVPPDQAVVHTAVYAQFEGEELEIAGESDIRIKDWREQTGTPLYLLGGATALTLVPEPDADGTLTLLVVLKPTPGATDIADFLYNEYREPIVHGALSRLLLSPKKPYTDAGLASYHQHQFQVQTAAAGMRVARNYTRSPLRTSIMRR